MLLVTYNALKALHISLALGDHFGILCGTERNTWRGSTHTNRQCNRSLTMRLIRQVRQRVERADDKQFLLVEHRVQLGHAD